MSYMNDYLEIDFLGVETDKSGDAIALRYRVGGQSYVHIVDGGYIDTGDQLVKHITKFYGTTRVDNVVLTHPDRDHANGLRKVLDVCQVGRLWMNRPWLYADELIHRFETYNSVDALRRRLRQAYDASAMLEDIALEKGIPISAPFQGAQIGIFTVLAPTKERYLDLVVESDKTPEAAQDGFITDAVSAAASMFKAAANLVKSAWGHEYFPASGTSSENEMSVVQVATMNGRPFVLTGDVGREGLKEAADYAPLAGLRLPGLFVFQVPHHGGRHNVNTEVLDRWLGPRLAGLPERTAWKAICSSAKADLDHPRKSVKRAMMHRGGHFSATEGRCIHIGEGIKREDWTPIPQAAYPTEQED